MKILYRLKKILVGKLLKGLMPVYHFLWGALANFYYKNPSRSVIVIGITGTTGKTTSTYLLAEMLRRAGHKTGFSSTAMFSDGDKDWLNDKKMTMIGRGFTQRLLKQMVKNKCTYAIIETTSEGIRQFRHKFINYDILVFTGLYPEHIESHGSFDKYKQAKQRLFKYLKSCPAKYTNDQHEVILKASKLKKLELNRVKKAIVANGDDKHVFDFIKFWAQEKFVYTSKTPEEYISIATEVGYKHAKDLQMINFKEILANAQGTSFMSNNQEINLKLLGEFNVLNAANSIGVGLSRRLSWEQIKFGLESVEHIPGRLEQINVGQNFLTIIDYAFEPKAVTKLYETVALLQNSPAIETKGKIIHVLGSAGGGRDKARRPKLGKLAGQTVDYMIVTNEDPYDEDPLAIIKQVAEGALSVGKKEDEDLFLILDRREAIQKALSLASRNDIVLFTGKGSEQAICLANGQKMKWDEREIVREELNRLLVQ